MGMCCKGKNKQGQYKPWECVVKVKQTNSHGLYCPCLFLPLQHIPMVCIAPLFLTPAPLKAPIHLTSHMGMCCKGKNKQGQYRPWECVVKVKTNKGNTNHGNVL
jgi:hypothetical protein